MFYWAKWAGMVFVILAGSVWAEQADKNIPVVPNKEIQAVLQALASTNVSVRQEFLSACTNETSYIKTLENIEERAGGRQTFLQQLIYFCAHATDTHEAMMPLVVIHELNVSVEDQVAAVRPVLETDNQDFLKVAYELLQPIDFDEKLDQFDFSKHEDVFRKMKPDIPEGLVEYMYTTSPDAALLSMISVYLDKGEADTLKLHVQSGDDALVLSNISSRSEWWAELYVAAKMKDQVRLQDQLATLDSGYDGMTSYGGTNDFPIVIQDSSETFHIRFRGCTNYFPVVFEDGSLSEPEQSAIMKDFRLVVVDQELLDRRSKNREKRTIRVEGSQLHLSVFFCFSGSHNRPQGYGKEYRTIGIAENGSEHLVIPIRLSNAYRQALALQDKHPVAFQRLDAFIEYMNNLENVPLPATDDVLYFGDGAESDREEYENDMYRCFISDFSKYKCIKLSILSVLIKEDKPCRELLPELSDEEFDRVLVTEVMFQRLDKKGSLIDTPLIYHDEKWKVVLYYPGT